MDTRHAADLREFGKLLRHHRILARLTQEQLAEQAKLSVHSISNLERGVPHLPRADTLHLLTSALQLSDEDRLRLELAATGMPRTALHPTKADDRPPEQPVSRIPLAPTPLIGRQALLEEIVACLSRPEVRLLTLVGSPGVGKTRLAIAVATHPQLSFTEAKEFVSLVSLTDPGQVLPVITRALGQSLARDQTALESAIDAVRDRDLLLVLDNFEHVAAAAPEVAALLAACSGLKVLVTSRAGLQIRGEQQRQVPPLAVPKATEGMPLHILASVPAVALFIERARAILPSFRLTQANAQCIAAICRQLDGLPLAIELAAGRLQLYAPPALQKQLVRRLSILSGGAVDLPPHQRTLRSALAWSYDLLSPATQALFRCVAAFSGGASPEAVEAISRSAGMLETGAEDVLDTLAVLVNANLLLRHEGAGGKLRVGMLETIREYGREQLATAREGPQVERAYAEYFLALAEAADSGLKGPDQAIWLERLEQEHANLRAALQWALENEEAERGMRLAASLWRFWDARGYVREGRQWLEAFLAMADPAPDAYTPAALAIAHSSTGILAWRLGDYECAEKHQTAALELHQQLDDQSKIASDFNNLATIAHSRGDYARAWELLEACLSIHRQLGDTRRIALVLKNLGAVAFDQGELAHATGYIEESLQLRRQTGDQRGIASSLVAVGEIAREQGCYVKAKESLAEALRVYRRLRERLGTAVTIHSLASIDYDLGNFERARRRCQFSLSTLQEVDKGFYLAQVQVTVGKIAYATGDHTTARVHFEESIALRHKLSDHLRIAESFSWLALIADAQADNYQALTHLRESLTIYQSYKTTHNVTACLEALGLVLHGQSQRAPARATLEMATALRIANGTPQPPAERSLLAHRLAGDATWLAGSQIDPRQSGALTTSIEWMLVQAQSFIAEALAHLPC